MTSTKWSIDPTHSEIQFKIKHLKISTVTGQFKEFRGEVETRGDDFSTAKIRFTADINSIFTNNTDRDEHLKKVDFLDAEKHSLLSFESDKMEKIDDENFQVHGILTLKGVPKEIVLHAEFGGLILDPWGNSRAGFTVSGKIRRRDHNITLDKVTEAGGLLGDEIKIFASAELVKQLELEPA